MNIGQMLETHLGWAASRLGFRAVTPVFDGADENEIEAELARAWLIDEAWNDIGDRAWAWLKEQDYDPESIRDDDEVRLLYLESWLGDKGYEILRFNSDRNYARRSTLIEWLREKGFNPDEVLTFESMGRRKKESLARDVKAVLVC